MKIKNHKIIISKEEIRNTKSNFGNFNFMNQAIIINIDKHWDKTSDPIINKYGDKGTLTP